MGEGYFKQTTEKRSQKTDRLMNFKKIFREGRRTKSPHFGLYGILNGLELSRLGISISRRSSPLSTRRNRIKRIIREYWRLRGSHYSENKDFILVARKGISALRNEDIFKELSYIFNKNLS